MAKVLPTIIITGIATAPATVEAYNVLLDRPEEERVEEEPTTTRTTTITRTPERRTTREEREEELNTNPFDIEAEAGYAPGYTKVERPERDTIEVQGNSFPLSFAARLSPGTLVRAKGSVDIFDRTNDEGTRRYLSGRGGVELDLDLDPVILNLEVVGGRDPRRFETEDELRGLVDVDLDLLVYATDDLAFGTNPHLRINPTDGIDEVYVDLRVEKRITPSTALVPRVLYVNDDLRGNELVAAGMTLAHRAKGGQIFYIGGMGGTRNGVDAGLELPFRRRNDILLKLNGEYTRDAGESTVNDLRALVSLAFNDR